LNFSSLEQSELADRKMIIEPKNNPKNIAGNSDTQTIQPEPLGSILAQLEELLARMTLEEKIGQMTLVEKNKITA